MSLQPNQRWSKGTATGNGKKPPNGHRGETVGCLSSQEASSGPNSETPKMRNRYSSAPSSAQELGAASLPGDFPRSPSMG